LSPAELPPFRPRGPWWGPDLQTLRNALRRDQRDETEGQRLTLALRDGGALVGRLDRPPEPTDRPLVVAVHGLAGSEASFYMVSTARHLVGLGFPVLRLNLRGAGPSGATSRGHYHAGRTEDFADVLAGLPPVLSRNGLLLLGFSLGGNMLLKFLGELPAATGIVAAATVSAPIDMAATARRMLAPRNRVYHRYVLRAIKREVLGSDAILSPADRRLVMRARTVIELDDRFIAPRNGFADAWDYYARNSSIDALATIRHRTLVIHAFDDPWIPAESYRRVDWEANPMVSAVLTRQGGHIGFHGHDSRVPWHDRVVGAFFSSLMAPEPRQVFREVMRHAG
jgi:predicted alpha/beta-fold hydrolase